MIDTDKEENDEDRDLYYFYEQAFKAFGKNMKYEEAMWWHAYQSLKKYNMEKKLGREISYDEW